MKSVYQAYPTTYFERVDAYGIIMPNYHIHDQYELSLCTEGEILLDSGSMHIPLKAPFIRILKPYNVHLVTVSPQTHYIRTNIYFTGNILDGIDRRLVNLEDTFTSEVTIIHPTAEQTVRIKQLADAVTAKGNHEINPLLVAALLREISQLTPEINPPQRTVKYQYICDVIRYICEHYMDDISTANLAAQHFISVAKLNRDFRRYTQTTVREFLIRVRLRGAVDLLTDHSVTDAAHLCGFNDVSHFIRTFRQYYGVTPHQYMKHT